MPAAHTPAVAVDDRPPRHLLSADYLAHVEEDPGQPHQRSAERPPFYPTHEFAQWSVHLNGVSTVIQERLEVMAVDGLGYTREQWEGSQLPGFDVDRFGSWYDLEHDRPLLPPFVPDDLPERYALWTDSGGEEHLLAIGSRTGVVELPSSAAPAAERLARDLRERAAIAPLPADRLAAALAALPPRAWVVARQDVVGLARGDRHHLVDASADAADGMPVRGSRGDHHAGGALDRRAGDAAAAREARPARRHRPPAASLTPAATEAARC